MRQNSFRSCSRMRKFPSRVRCNTILSLLCEGKNRQNQRPMKYWEIIADNLSKAGWSWGCVSAIDSNGRTIWIADAHRGDGKRFVVRSDEKLTAFLELKSAIRGCGFLFHAHGSLKSPACSCISITLPTA